MSENKNFKYQVNNTTFIIEMKSCDNHSWQGILTWVEAKKSKSFRSALELVKMIDSVMVLNQEDASDEEKDCNL
ncbi:MAG: hypothetical protein RR986_04585 [Longicatena sp.]